LRALRLTLFFFLFSVINYALLAQIERDTIKLESIDSVELLSNESVRVMDVMLVGNKKTKKRIILREMKVEPGKAYKRNELYQLLEEDRNNIYNTRLFVSVYMHVVNLPNNRAQIIVRMRERWYLIPVPIFKIADRNINEWFTDRNRDFSRVNYGIKVFHNNFRGYNERLKLILQFGFSRDIELRYIIPFINKKQTNGLIFNLKIRENKQIAYKSEDHNQVFIDSKDFEEDNPIKDDNLQETYSGGITFTNRKNLYDFHFLQLSFRMSEVSDTIAKLNPRYFLDNRTEQKYFMFRYIFRRDHRDIRVYPLSGYLWSVQADTIGFGIFGDINQLEIKGDYARYFDLGKGFYFSSLQSGKISFPKDQPYVNSRAIGYGNDVIRGFELNVTEGQTFFLTKNTFKKRLFKTVQNVGKIMPVEQFREFPLEVYIKTFFDGGIIGTYVTDADNTRLTDEPIFAGGGGLDIVTFYDFVLRLEYSRDSARENHFFVNFNAEF